MTGDLVMGLTGIVILMSLLSFGTVYLISSNNSEKNIQQRADRYLNYLTKSLKQPLWTLDDFTVKQIGDAYMSSTLFSFIEIKSTEPNVHTLYLKVIPEDTDFIVREGLIENKNEIIGHIKLGFSKIPYKNELRRLLFYSLWISSAIVLVMLLVAFVMLRFFVRQPINFLLEVAEDMAHGHYDYKNKTVKYYEVEVISKQLFDMADSIKSREASLKNANRDLMTEVARRIESERESDLLRNYLSNIINAMPSMLIAVDASSHVRLWNSRTEEITGLKFEHVENKPLLEVFPQFRDKINHVHEALRTREAKGEIYRSHGPDNESVYEDITIFPLTSEDFEGAVIRIDDITERIRLKEMMIQGEKMLSVGGLAAGMAHEINNPLAGILQTAGVMKERLFNNIDMPANRQAAEKAGITTEAIRNFMETRGIVRMMSTIIESGKRIADVINNMLSFARKGDAIVSSHHVEDLIDKTLELAVTDYDLKKRYDFKAVEIIKEYGTKNLQVLCEASKIQQVLLNIFRNGAEAMEQKPEIRSKFIIRTAVDEKRHMYKIEIEDNGPGMEESVRKRIFEPFFTTKPVGIGTGLGLSVSYFIITENHGGEMEVSSEPGKGTVFTINLPLKRE